MLYDLGVFSVSSRQIFSSFSDRGAFVLVLAEQNIICLNALKIRGPFSKFAPAVRSRACARIC